VVRPSKTTKEIDVGELEQLKKPEARETTAFDPTELQGLIAASREDDDLALPIEVASSTPLPLAAASNVSPMPSASSSVLLPMPENDFDDDPDHYTAEVPPTTTIPPPRVARGSAGTPKAHRPLTKPTAPRTSMSLLPWILVALASAVVIALAFWR
jgi:hypothetical protein